MPHSRKMGAFTLRQMTLITFGKLKRSPNQTPALQFVRLISIYRKVNSDASSGERRVRSMVGIAEDFPGQITLRFPTVLTKAHCHCARVILTKEFNAALPYLLYPGVADSLVVREVPRSGNNQARPRGVKECVRAGFSGMMLALDDNVALQVQAAGQQCLFRLDATVRHEQNPGRRRD